MLDGFSNIKKLVKRAKEMEMPAVALTDHGTMHGTIEFFSAANDAGVKPIIGLEAYLAARGMKDKDFKLDGKSFHLLLLAENQTGYKNLLKIATAAQLEGFYRFPRIDREFLAAHNEGLIATSGCLAAEIPRAIVDGNADLARQKLDWYYDVFGPDRFFIELQAHDIPELTALNKALLDLGPRYKAKYVATNDVHYVDPTDARLQDIMLAIQTGCVLSDPKRMRMSDASYHLRSPAEMHALFGEVPGALSNTLLIAERCSVDLKSKGYHLPLFPVPEGHTDASYLRALCETGLIRRYGARANDETIRLRLDYELSVIEKMGFSAYFLIVWDLCRFARAQNIWYNARGSAAGSMVAYVLDITLVEPLEHGLIFERFLNPGRISMPDIDLDFQDDLRYRMLDYCVHKYGDDKVAQIITFGTLGARAAIRDVGRVMDIPLSEVDRVAKTIPNIPGKPISITQALEEVADLKRVYDEARGEQAYIRELIDTAAQVEGVVRNAGTHAAGVVIGDKPLVEYLPLHRPTGANGDETPIKTVTQFEMGILEKLGMLKVDFLGLATLTIMQRACDMIAARHGKRYTLDNIPTDHPATYELMGRGQTAGVFQVEGTGMKRYLMQMKPKTLDNIIAMISLYRPGPLEFIPNYIKRMHGQERVDYKHPSLEPIFAETYGIPVYQEQIMRAAVDLAGYSMSESDDLRKAIAKKQKEQLLKHQEKFVRGAVERGMPQSAAEGIFKDWEEFARYGFNKCLPAETEVIDAASGRLVTIGELYARQALIETVTLDEADLRLRTGQVSAVMANGVKPVFRLTTASGRTIEATSNHPFYTLDGWRMLAELAEGEQIAIPRRLSVAGNADWPEHEVIALGHLLAEGDLCHPHSVCFYSQDCEQVDDFVRAADAFENVACTVAVHQGTFSVYAKRRDRTRRPGIMDWAEGLGILGKNARTKEIPPAAFELRGRQLGLLLSRMWEDDGHIDLAGRSLSYATASSKLARHVQHVLLRLGISSRVRAVPPPCKEGHVGYQVCITGNANLKAFADHVAVHFVSYERRAKVISLTENVLLSDSVLASRPFAYAPRRGSALGPSITGYFDDPAHGCFADSDVHWDEIVSIAFVGQKETYDLEVPGTHNFVANDFIVHNSHAADYGVIAAQTAYLKARYPAEYMTALLSVSKGETEKVALYIEDARQLGIRVLPPDVNRSGLDFTIEDTLTEDGRRKTDPSSAIRFGLAAIKNVGEGAVDVIVQARGDQPFSSLDDLCRRVDLRQVGRKAMESLIKVGAFDGFGDRAQLLEGLDQIMAASSAHFKAEDAGQMSLFGGEGGAVSFASLQLPKVKVAVSKRDMLSWEKELIGLYVSDHPLQSVIDQVGQIVTHYAGQLTEEDHGKPVVMAGVVSTIRAHTTKKGDPMGFVGVEDLQGQLELVIFPRVWREVSAWLTVEQIIVIYGKADTQGGGNPKILVDSLRQDFKVAAASNGNGKPNGHGPTPAQAILWEPDQFRPPARALEPPPIDDWMPPPDDDWMTGGEEAEDGGRKTEVRAEPAAPKSTVPATNVPHPVSAVAELTPPAVSRPASGTSSVQPPSALRPPSSADARRVIIQLLNTGDKDKDLRLLRHVHGLLSSYPGQDEFEFEIHERNRHYQLRFPNHNTDYTPELAAELTRLLGRSGTVTVR